MIRGSEPRVLPTTPKAYMRGNDGSRTHDSEFAVQRLSHLTTLP